VEWIAFLIAEIVFKVCGLRQSGDWLSDGAQR